MAVRTLPVLLFILFLSFSFPAEDACSGQYRQFLLSKNDAPDIMDGFDDDGGLDDILEGFEDNSESSYDIPENTTVSAFSLDGFFKIGSSYNIAHDEPEQGETDWRGLSRLQTELQVDVKAKFTPSWQAQIGGKYVYDAAYTIHGRSDYTDDVLDAYEKECELGEAFILGTPAKQFDIKIGRQIVVWGKSDNIRVTDILNPLDNREPGLTDIEDLRLPVTMTRLDYYVNAWSLTGIAIHEIRFDKNPEYGNDFYPYSEPPPHEDIPSDGGHNTEYGVAVNGVFTGWDIAFYWAKYCSDTSHIELDSIKMEVVSLFPTLQYETDIETELRHEKQHMIGTAFNMALGNWLIKAEAAYIDGIQFFNYPKKDNLETTMTGMTIKPDHGKDYSRTDILAGIEYLGFNETSICFEAAKRHINNYEDRLSDFLDEFQDIIAMYPEEFGSIMSQIPGEADENEYQVALRVTRNFMNDTLEMTFLAYLFGRTIDAGSLERLSTSYDLSDSIKLTGGIILYQSGETAEYKTIGDNDRFFLDIRYSF